MKMNEWSLTKLLAGLHDDIESRLSISRATFRHPGTKGDASERVWLELLQTYLPKRYQAEKAHVVDSRGNFSEQIDVVIFDRQYSPFIFRFQEQIIVPAESVYAAFEAKQAIAAEQVRYAQDKIASVRRLHRTSLPIPHAGGIFPAKPLFPIIGGLLTFECDWIPPLGDSLGRALATDDEDRRLDIGCLASHGTFVRHRDRNLYDFTDGCKPATGFLLKLIAMLQFSGTVPMIDIEAYECWLT